MTDVERAVRESVARRAGITGVRLMPEGTLRQIRRRKARFAVGVAVVTATAVVAGVLAFRALPSGDGSPDRVPASEESWPTVREAAPGVAFVPEVTGDPQDLTVLASGSVQGADFSLVGWTGDSAEYQGPCVSFSGPFTAGAAAQPPPSGSGFGGMVSENCASWPTPSVPDGADLELLGQQDGSTPSLMANYGFVSPRVAQVSVFAGNPAEEIEVELLDGPVEWAGVRSFAFFPPPGTEGMLIASDEAGKPLARAVICTNRPDLPGGCRGITEPLVLIGPGVPETPIEAPSGWPEATFGGDIVPYVDHSVDLDGQMDPGITTPKVVVAFGNVGSTQWTMTGFVSDGEDYSAEGPCGEFFLDSEGAGGGGTFCLGVGLRDRDLGVTGLGFGDAGVTAYVGIVSDVVDHVEVSFDEGGPWQPDLLPGPEGMAARYFVFFPPNGIRGEIVALGADGAGMGSSTMCTEITDPGSIAVCG